MAAGIPNHTINYFVPLAPSTPCSVGQILLTEEVDGDYFVVATTANRNGRRSEGVACTAWGGVPDHVGVVKLVQDGILPAEISGLSSGYASLSLVRCSATGTMERIASFTTGDDVIGYAEKNGRVHLYFGLPWELIEAISTAATAASAAAASALSAANTAQSTATAAAAAAAAAQSTANTALTTSILGWQNAYDVDFTSLGTVAISGAGNVTIDGRTWNVVNYGKLSSAGVSAANGLYMVHAGSTSTFTPVGVTAPYITGPSLNSFLSGLIPDDGRFGIRFQYYFKSKSIPTNGDSIVVGASTNDTNLQNQRYEFEQYRTGGIDTDWLRLVLNNVLKASGDIGAIISGHNCVEFSIPYFGLDLAVISTGIYSSGWPTKWYPRADLNAAAGSFWNIKMNEQSLGFPFIGVTQSNAASATAINVGRMRIDYYRYY